ncbi:response regulator transcription factor [Kutzneria sp. 744]|uniref:LuxR C-terminal-related transcriptional regulator n=1 Tax=Kutzneria sp. (strain 744) TaxID=345341 RepID=UPI0003EED574|nr:response regulator transcription factor [Kutzneria sp. 744]EWM11271.1 nitrate/nitrite response regulator NarL [Kutzneria sp. 744]
MTRILLADSQPVFVDGLCTHVTRTPDLDVVAVAGTQAELIELLRTAVVDVVVLGIGLNLVEGAAENAAVLVVSASTREEDVTAAMSAGAAGYVTRQAGPEDILTAIRVVARGGLFVTADMAPLVRNRIGAARVDSFFPQLTPREQDVLELLVRDAGTTAIARHLGITVKTVRNHVSNILVKLPARSRAEAAWLAREKLRVRPSAHTEPAVS